MTTSGNFITYHGSSLCYSKTGNGPTPLLLFHGFGQSNAVFEDWADALKLEFTIYAFDLYFHGQSTWPSREPLEKNDWKEIMRAFLERENVSSFELAAFSLGGKFAMATLEAFPEKVKKLTLLAPDGIKTSFWYSLATYPLAIRSLFKSMVLSPGRFNALARTLHGFGIVNKGLLRFAEAQMDTEEKRRRVYYSWVYFRHLKFDLKKIAAILNTNKIPLLLIIGKFDKVIPAENMTGFLQHVNTKKLEIVEAGHNDLIKNARGLLVTGKRA